MSGAPNATDKKEYIIANVVLAAVIICAFAIGFAAIFLFVLLPACLAYIFTRFRAVYGVLSAALVVFVPSLIMMGLDIYTFIMTVPTAVLTAYSLRKKRGLLHAVVCGTCGWFISLALVLMIGGAAVQLDEMKAVFEASLAMVMEAYQLSGEQTLLIYEMLVSLLPAVLICMMALASYGAIYICLFAIKLRDSSYFGIYRPFCCIKADKMCLLATVISFVLSFMTDGLILKALVNIIIVLTAFMLICGISTISFFARKIKRKAIRIPVYILMFLSIFVTSSMYLFVGFMDAFMNIRGLVEPKR